MATETLNHEADDRASRFGFTAANADRFTPPELDDDAFVKWAFRIAMRLRNLPAGSPDHIMRSALVSEGTPSPAWAAALKFMIMLSCERKPKVLTV